MEAKRLEHFRRLLIDQLHKHTEHVRDNQSAALEMGTNDDGVKDAVDMSLMDVNQEIALRRRAGREYRTARLGKSIHRGAGCEQGTACSLGDNS